MNQQPLIITIDGPAGTGKSTVAHCLANRLGLEFLDTGAMYRAAALLSLKNNIDVMDGKSLAAAIETAHLHFDWTSDPPKLLVHDCDVTSDIREREVSERVSQVAGRPEVRAVLVQAQRRIGAEHPRLVTEGRDQGSVVFPDAAVQFYLDARPEVRAKRRGDQLEAAGKQVDRQKLLVDIVRRDSLDSSRSDGPLIKPTGAIVIDTSEMTLEEVVDRLQWHVQREVNVDSNCGCSR